MGLIKTAVKTAVAVKTAHVVHDRIERRKQEKWVAQGNPPDTFPGALPGATGMVSEAPGVGGSSAEPSDPSVTAAPGPMADVLAQLRELADLKAEGVLSETEFEAQKQRILAQR